MRLTAHELNVPWQKPVETKLCGIIICAETAFYNKDRTSIEMIENMQQPYTLVSVALSPCGKL